MCWRSVQLVVWGSSPLCWVHGKPWSRPQAASTAQRVCPSRRPCLLPPAGQRVLLVPLAAGGHSNARTEPCACVWLRVRACRTTPPPSP